MKRGPAVSVMAITDDVSIQNAMCADLRGDMRSDHENWK